ncbi:MAG TPA: PQQ-dependent sugar dehydrogenase [Gaiellaceae bacterium]
MAALAFLLAPACSSSSGSEAIPTAAVPSTTAPAPPTTTLPPATAPTTTAPAPTPLPRGTVEITSLRRPPPPENLPRFRAVKIADANYPAGLAAAPDGRIFYSELWGGAIRVIRRDGSVDPEPWADVNRKFGIRWVQFFHGGLSGIAFDPDFERNHFVYVVTQKPNRRTGFAAKSLIVRYKEVKGRGTAPRVLLRLPARKFDNTYSLVFGRDGMLYVPIGLLGASRTTRSGSPAGLLGSILRVTPAGKAPGDNPLGDVSPLVWARGFKNVFDLAFLPGTDVAVGGENGTSAHDEIDLLMAGRDYGYPEHEGFTRTPRLTPPMLDYGSENPGPVGIIYYDGRRYPTLRGRFLMCNNHGDGMVALRIARSDPGRLGNLTPVVSECTLDLVQTPKGTVVFSDAGAVYRLAPG